MESDTFSIFHIFTKTLVQILLVMHYSLADNFSATQVLGIINNRNSDLMDLGGFRNTIACITSIPAVKELGARSLTCVEVVKVSAYGRA